MSPALPRDGHALAARRARCLALPRGSEAGEVRAVRERPRLVTACSPHQRRLSAGICDRASSRQQKAHLGISRGISCCNRAEGCQYRAEQHGRRGAPRVEEEGRTPMRTDKGRLWAALVALAVIGGALAGLGATAGHASALRHVVTPMISIGHNWAIEGVVDPTSQVGPLRACQTRLTPSAAGSCYGPDQIRVAYGIQPLLDQSITGAGRTIVIIDAYGSSTLAADTGLFNAYMGLPATSLNVIYPDGPPLPTDPNNAFGWAAETTLDVTWAHVIAPAATIDLVVAKSNNDADILSATQYVADHNLGDVVSQSYGEAEQCMDPALLAQQHKVFGQLAKEGITLFASSGDQGAALPSCSGPSWMKAASTPATDPLVTAVGGTQLIAQPATALGNGGTWINEVTWNEGAGSATGGGVSSVYSRPDYQAPVVKDTHMREIPGHLLQRRGERRRPCGADQGWHPILLPLRRDERRLAAMGRPHRANRPDGGRPRRRHQQNALQAGQRQHRIDLLPRHHRRRQQRPGRPEHPRHANHRLPGSAGLGRGNGLGLARREHTRAGNRKARQRLDRAELETLAEGPPPGGPS